MSFLDLNLNDVPARELLPEGEYQLRCTNAEVKDSKSSSNQFIELRLEPVGSPQADIIIHRIMLPNGEDDERKRINKLRNIKEATTAFGIDTTRGLDTNAFNGATAWALLRVTPEDGQYPSKNEVNRFVAGH